MCWNLTDKFDKFSEIYKIFNFCLQITCAVCYMATLYITYVESRKCCSPTTKKSVVQNFKNSARNYIIAAMDCRINWALDCFTPKKPSNIFIEAFMLFVELPNFLCRVLVHFCWESKPKLLRLTSYSKHPMLIRNGQSLQC